MATIGVTRGLGDHDLKVHDSNIYIKPFLSSAPEVPFEVFIRILNYKIFFSFFLSWLTPHVQTAASSCCVCFSMSRVTPFSLRLPWFIPSSPPAQRAAQSPSLPPSVHPTDCNQGNFPRELLWLLIAQKPSMHPIGLENQARLVQLACKPCCNFGLTF